MSQQAIIETPFATLMRESVRSRGIYIADRLAAPISSPSETGKYRYATREEINRKAKTTKNASAVDDNRVGPGGKYNVTENKFTTDSFLCLKAGEESKLTDEDKARAANYFDAQNEASQRAIFATLFHREKRIIAQALATATFSNAAATATWDANPTTATPFDDFAKAADIISGNLGMEVGPFTELVGVMNPVDYRALTNTDDFKDRFKFTQAGMRKPETLKAIAEALGINDLWIASAKDGATPLWTTGKSFLSFVSTTENLEMDPRALNQFYWDQFEDGFMASEMRRDQALETEFHKAREYRVDKVINKYAGYIITGTHS